MNINRLPKKLRAIVPYSIKRFLVRMYVKWNMYGSGIKIDKPRISFAEILPKEGSFIRGGKVKLTHLRNRFGEYKRKFNIIYLVSSTLPGFADIWVDEAKKKGVKVVWNQNGVGYPAWTPIWEKINQSMKIMSRADYIIYQSSFCKNGSDKWVTQTDVPFSIISNCCDTNAFKPSKQALSINPLKLLVMGTHMTSEKVLIPLEATRDLLNNGLDVELLIYGPCEWPRAEKEIEEKIKELNLEKNVVQKGKFLQEEAPDLYREGHIFIHLKHMDPAPTAILEAMSSGLPVVGSKSGGLIEWIPETAGILLDVPISWEKHYYPSKEAVANAVRKIAENLPLWSQSAREHALKNFDDYDWVEKHSHVFKQILS